MKIHNRTHITLTPDDIEKAIERYINSEIIEAPNGCDVKFIVKDVYAGDSLTGYYFHQFQGAEVTVLTHES